MEKLKIIVETCKLEAVEFFKYLILYRDQTEKCLIFLK